MCVCVCAKLRLMLFHFYLQHSKEIIKEYQSSALVNSERMNSSDINDSSHKSALTKTYDSTLDRSYENIHNKSYESTANRSFDSNHSKDYENVLHKSYDSPSSKLNTSLNKYDASVSRNSSSYDAINSKYSNFESSAIINRSTVYDSSSKNVGNIRESTPPKICYDSSPKRVSIYESSPSSPSKLDLSRRSSGHDEASFNSSYNSTFNTSSSTVINTGISTSKSSRFSKSPSPARLSS